MEFTPRRSAVILRAAVSFKYDPFGRRIYKSSSGSTSIYAYDGDNLIEETNSSGTAVARYSQGLNIDEPLAMLRSATTSYYNADGLGTITSLANTAGSLAQTYTFDSFGKQTASSGSLTNPFQYTARELDAESSLYYYRARYYDQGIGRFLSQDPLGFGADTDFYAYVHNGPTMFSDPRGLQQSNPWDDCTCTRTILKPRPSKPSSNILVCEYTCNCLGGKFVVLWKRVLGLKGCKDIQDCPYQIFGAVDPASSNPVLIPDPQRPPILQPPKTPKK